MTSYAAAASGVTPALEGGSIALGGDGALWFSGGFVPNQIGRMTTAGAVSYPVTRAAGLAAFNPGPLTRGPDGNIWFADPLAGIEIAGTIGTVDIATKVASEYSTPLMKTTIQISLRTSQDQKCDTGTAVCTPVATGTCVPDPARPAIPGIPASGADTGRASRAGLSRQHLPDRDDRADAGPGLHADRTGARRTATRRRPARRRPSARPASPRARPSRR